ncbi:hypothetical protein AB0L12_11145 [Streptomyces cellulosae]|uniref:SCO4225 family membrane protein n=1 Tax=Streptomyces cellulosae TaxID=1968 RepID=A0ABW6JFQ4_STRCE
MPTSPRFSPRRLLALATDGLAARAYLGVVGLGVLAPVVAPDSPYAMAPTLLTAPLSFLPILLPFGAVAAGSGPAQVAAAVVGGGWLLLCALVNAAAVGALLRRPDRRPNRRPAEQLPVQAPSARPRRALLAAAVDNWPARVYVAVVAAALGTFLYAVLLSPDPGFAGIWPILAAAPLSFLAVAVSSPAEYALPWLGTLLFTAGITLAGLVNAVLIGRLTRRIGGPATRG